MLDTIPVPADSKFGAMVARRLNASRPIVPVRSLTMSGPTGTGFAPLPQNLRDRRGSAQAANRSCFRLETRSAEGDEEGSVEPHRFLVDCYYNVGGKLLAVYDIDIEDLLPHPSDETADGGDEFDRVIYFELGPAGDLNVGSCYLGELSDLQNIKQTYVFPLYLFSAKGMLKTDLRTAPQLQMWEVL